jgi:murein DD-endopeptidase MepM/ murein hydrolase activator NlpD
MAQRRRGLMAPFAAAFSEKRISIQTDAGERRLRVTRGSQILLAGAGLLTLVWLALATAHVAIDLASADGQAGRGVGLHEAYRTRLNALTAERDQRASEALSAQDRFQVAMDQIGRQQTALLDAMRERHELAAALDLARGRLADTLAQRDEAEAAKDNLLAEMRGADAALRARSSEADLTETLQAVTGALTEAVAARDAAAAARESLGGKLAAAELDLAVASRRQDEMLTRFEQAVGESFGPLEELLRRADLDVETTVAALRPDHSGQGGPLVPLSVSSRSFDDGPIAGRFDELMADVDRMNLLKLAVGKVPYAMPVKDSHRFTSPFGHRHDPFHGGRRMHNGVDFAAPQGTPIHATADGVVTAAGRESGYGYTVRIRHDFGFETLYAHQARLYVEKGQRVSRGEHIGDMGSTGRSTGVHLHYEVHLNGRPVDPMLYVEAAKDVL